MKISVIGTGYVGLVSGVCLAAKGHDVTCLDISADLVGRLNAGKPHIFENGLEPLLARSIAEGRFRASLASVDALRGSRIILLAVGTPSTDGRIDLRQLEMASRLAGRSLRDASATSIVVKSTVVPGTTDTEVRGWLEAESGKRLGEFGLGMNPEFLREGEAVADFMDPDRIVLGCETEATWQALQELYEPWQCEKIRTNSRTAEMIKYANNAILATQISAVNELANIAAEIGGIDIYEVMAGVHSDKRWSPILPNKERTRPGILSYLWPGCGFGGSCFPKDVQALRSRAVDAGVEPRVLASVLSVNETQPRQVTRILKQVCGPLEGKRALVLGLAFKPDTDDIRESTSRRIIEDLIAEGVAVCAHDPMAMQKARTSWADLRVDYVDDWPSRAAGADIIVVATRWDEYRKLRATLDGDRLKGKVIFDARRFFEKSDFPGSTYLNIGNRPL